MRPVLPGDRVQVHYGKRLQNGSVRSSREPLDLTVGIHHSRLPGLGTGLVAMILGEALTLTVPAERAYGVHDPARVERWSRRRFPESTVFEPGTMVHFADIKGRARHIRILEVKDQIVVVDANHPWAGQAVELKVQLVANHDAN